LTLYVYAFVAGRASRPLGRGMARKPLATILVHHTRVVVEEASAPAPDAKTLAAHDRVVRRLGRAFDGVLPARFGTVVEGRDALRRRVRPEIRAAVERVRGAVQFTLRVSGVPAKWKPPPGIGPGTRFLAERRARLHVPEIAPLTERTRPFVRAAREERVIRGHSFASAYHLVPRDAVRGYRAALRASLPTLSVRVEISGPWPPYAFTELE